MATNRISKLLVILMGVAAMTPYPVAAQILQGNISKSGSVMRLARPVTGAIDSGEAMPPVAPPISQQRLARAGNALSGLVKRGGFAPPLKSSLSEDDVRLGIATPGQFETPRGFDLGAEANERELKLAWDLWHKQLSKTIYENWSRVADEPGRATLEVTVSNNRSITIAVLKSSGSNSFDRKLSTIIRSLDGNPGLSFPAKSRRQTVSFEADYVAARDITPGYSWVKNDVETIRERY